MPRALSRARPTPMFVGHVQQGIGPHVITTVSQSGINRTVLQQVSICRLQLPQHGLLSLLPGPRHTAIAQDPQQTRPTQPTALDASTYVLKWDETRVRLKIASVSDSAITCRTKVGPQKKAFKLSQQRQIGVRKRTFHGSLSCSGVVCQSPAGLQTAEPGLGRTAAGH